MYPFQARVPSGFVFPNASNTGYRTSLTPQGSGISTSSNDQVIENLDIDGDITVSHSGVTIRDCQCHGIWFTSTGSGVAEYCTITTPGVFKRGFWLDDCSDVTIRYCDISGIEDGIHGASNTNITIYRNYIHDHATTGEDPHYDGIQLFGCTNTTIEENNIQSRDTSAIFVTPASNLVIRGNKLANLDAFYVVHVVYSQSGVGSPNPIQFINNRFNAFDEYLSFAPDAGVTGANPTFSGNVDDVTSSNIDSILEAIVGS